eukprot:COSAG01_NODE_57716_length_310_cov_1.218009_1_plen_20_part_10
MHVVYAIMREFQTLARMRTA